MEYCRNIFVIVSFEIQRICVRFALPKCNSPLVSKCNIVIATLQISDKSVSTGLCVDPA